MFANEKWTRNALLCLTTLLLAAPQTVLAQRRGGGGPPLANRPTVTLNAGTRAAVVPFTLIGNVILVQATINGSQPIWMVFDTATPVTTIDSRTASALNVRPGASAAAAPGGAPPSGNATLGMPGLQATNQPLNTLPLDSLSRSLGFSVGGILGSSFVQGCAVQIDYTAKTLTFYNAQNFPAPSGQGALQLVTIGGSPYVSADLSLGGNATATGLFQVATGSNETLTVAQNFADSQGVLTKVPAAQTVASGDGSPTEARISRLKLGAYTLSQPVISVSATNVGAPALPPPSPTDVSATTTGGQATQQQPGGGGYGGRRRRGQGQPMIPAPTTPPADPATQRANQRAATEQRLASGVGGVIGGGLLHRFTVILDYPARVIALRSNSMLNAPFEADMSGLSLSAPPNGTGIIVLGVRDGSPGATAGLHSNDVILAVNGRSTNEIGTIGLAEMFRTAGVTYSLAVQRGSSQVQVSLTTQKVI